ncbi:hypothetical protein BP6252_04416 [Coleophoma cylindrospora]|uniref:Uncharacterized protein n=1 Tax=Coleophoma cylindrospora TaxID=1849047 RepID=A0A3D8S0I2_9HELO|nr:hypothetical protein BP6252_04416 [Coleophoma cylindrospora]
MPDLNSLPPSSSRSIPSSPPMIRAMSSSAEGTAIRGQTPSPRSTSTSLFAAAAVNAGLQHEDSRRGSSGASRNRPPSQSGRRRSNVLMNLQLNDPNLPGPGEMINEEQATSFRTASPQSIGGSPIISTGDPHHNRAPSLGEIHQELEQEQEAQVNRLLQMIRTQQQQLQQLQATAGQNQATPPVIDDSTPTSERSMSFSLPNPPQAPTSVMATPRSPRHPRSSFDLARADIQRRSRTPSRAASPRIRASSISAEGGEAWSLGGRDESAFYQAETQMMIRENQMLRQRIRELERQLSDLNPHASISHEPTSHSHLTHSHSVTEATPISTPSTVPGTFPTSATDTDEVKDD